MMAATYVGNMMGDNNMTMFGDIWAREAIQEFERFDTLSEVRLSFPQHFSVTQKLPSSIPERMPE